MTTSILTVRLNNDDKITFANMCKDLGMNTSTAINMFIRDCIKKRAILGLECEDVDVNGFTKADREFLNQSIAQLQQGKVVKYEDS